MFIPGPTITLACFALVFYGCCLPNYLVRDQLMIAVQVTATSIPYDSAGVDDTSYRTSVPECSLSPSLEVSIASKCFDMFTATDAASATMDFTKESVDDGVVDSPPSRGPVRTPICSPSPLKRLCTSPSRQRSMSPTHPTSRTPQRQLYSGLEAVVLPRPLSIPSPPLVNLGETSRRPQPVIPVINIKGTRTTRSLGGVPRQVISSGNPLPQQNPLGSRPPVSRRASCTPRPYPAHVPLASPSSSRPSRSLDSLRRREGESFDLWFSRRSETLGTSYMRDSRHVALIRGTMKHQAAEAKLLENLAKLNGSKSKNMEP